MRRRRGLVTLGVIASVVVTVLAVAGAASGRVDRMMNPHDLVVTKTAVTGWERVNTWTVSKSVDPEVLELPAGGSGSVTWHVDVTKTGTSMRNAVVSGTITITNPNPRVENVSVTDSLPGAVVDCGGGASSGLSIVGGGTLECTYSAPLTSTDPGTNLAEVTGTLRSSGRAVSGSGSAGYTFGDPAVDINASVTAVDGANTWDGIIGTSSFTYQEQFDCSDTGRTNVVRLLGDNPATSEVETDYELVTDSASTTVTCGSTTPPPPPPPPPPPGGESMDLQVVKEASPQAQLVNGQADITYSLLVRNNGPNQAHNVVVSDAAPSGVTFMAVTSQPANGNCTIASALLDCTLGSLGPGVERTIGFTARVTQTGTYENCATVTGEGGDTSSANNTDCAETLVTAPVTPPVTSPVTPPVTPKPKPKPTPNICRVLKVRTGMVKANGQRQVLVASVTRSRNPVKGVKVRFRGAGVSKAVRTNGSGLARLKVRTQNAGIIRVHIVNAKACNSARIGVVGVFEPPVTG